MIDTRSDEGVNRIQTLDDLAQLSNYSLIDSLNCDPDALDTGMNHQVREVFTGHYVPVKPTPILNPEYVSHSQMLFNELGFSEQLALSPDFIRMFSGDISGVPEPMRQIGWACGYALSIYGTEYVQQCPFGTGNGYGDGRAVSILEVLIDGQYWEMQLKGGGKTPYCRGADGRAVLRSSIREFLAQEHMYALGVPTSRSLCLYASKTDTVKRPWYSEGAWSTDPDILISEVVAITTRVAPSFIRVGQLELFARRARKNEHPHALEELKMIVLHLIDREYSSVIDKKLPTEEKILLLAIAFQSRLTSLMANWVRVGYCQGNFNSDNCAAGGFTLDYGPFGFCEEFDPSFQPWTGGGEHFSFLNQPVAAEKNYHMFCMALRPLLSVDLKQLRRLDEIRAQFSTVMELKMKDMWTAKLGLDTFDNTLVSQMLVLMETTAVDYTIFFRELSKLPDEFTALKKSFYRGTRDTIASAHQTYETLSVERQQNWSDWFTSWKLLIQNQTVYTREQRSKQMKQVNPKYSLREWLVVPAYEQASKGNYSLVRALQNVVTHPYDEQSNEVEEQYNKLKPAEFFELAGYSYYSCSS